MNEADAPVKVGDKFYIFCKTWRVADVINYGGPPHDFPDWQLVLEYTAHKSRVSHRPILYRLEVAYDSVSDKLVLDEK